MPIQVAVSSCGLPDHNKFSCIEFIRIATMPKVIHHHVITYSVLYSFVKVHTLRVDCPPLCKLLEESQPQCYFDRSFDLGSTPYRFGFIISNLGCHHHPSYHLPEKQAYIENSTPEGSLPSRKRCAYARSAYVDSHRLYGKRYGIFKVQIACLIGCVVATLSQDTFQGVSASEMLFLFYSTTNQPVLQALSAISSNFGILHKFYYYFCAYCQQGVKYRTFVWFSHISQLHQF